MDEGLSRALHRLVPPAQDSIDILMRSTLAPLALRITA
jgi:hypothetical protein